MTRSTLLVAAVLAAGCNTQGGGAATSNAPLTTEDDKTLYALGLTVARNLGQFHLKPNELALVERGLTDGVNGTKPQVELEKYGPKIQPFAHQRMMAGAEETKKKGAEFADKAAQEPGAQKLASGLVIKTITPGTGPNPAATDRVKVHYHGTLIDGTVFDSSRDRGTPAEFPLNGVIPCWTEGVQKMKVGEKAKLVCPSNIAYGDGGRPPKIPGGATLVFEVELLEILPPQAPGAMSMPPGSPPKGFPGSTPPGFPPGLKMGGTPPAGLPPGSLRLPPGGPGAPGGPKLQITTTPPPGTPAPKPVSTPPLGH
jgi:FKBP-type peptidyl-prolyl cis-trans isomerase FkpA